MIFVYHCLLILLCSLFKLFSVPKGLFLHSYASPYTPFQAFTAYYRTSRAMTSISYNQLITTKRGVVQCTICCSRSDGWLPFGFTLQVALIRKPASALPSRPVDPSVAVWCRLILVHERKLTVRKRNRQHHHHHHHHLQEMNGTTSWQTGGARRVAGIFGRIKGNPLSLASTICCSSVLVCSVQEEPISDPVVNVLVYKVLFGKRCRKGKCVLK